MDEGKKPRSGVQLMTDRRSPMGWRRSQRVDLLFMPPPLSALNQAAHDRAGRQHIHEVACCGKRD